MIELKKMMIFYRIFNAKIPQKIVSYYKSEEKSDLYTSKIRELKEVKVECFKKIRFVFKI